MRILTVGSVFIVIKIALQDKMKIIISLQEIKITLIFYVKKIPEKLTQLP